MTNIKINTDEYEIYEDTFDGVTVKSVGVTLHYNDETPDEAFSTFIGIGVEVESWDDVSTEFQNWDSRVFYYMETIEELEDAIINGHYEFTITGA